MEARSYREIVVRVKVHMDGPKFEKWNEVLEQPDLGKKKKKRERE